MNTTSAKPIADYLRSYSAYVEFWDSEAGDTHELLGGREILRDRAGELTAADLAVLRRMDERVLSLVDESQSTQGWDVAMLRKTADLIRNERTAPLRHAA